MIDEIFLFINLVDVGSFSKLSDKLDVNQPTLTRRIRALEDKFGTLLIRTPQGVRVTDEGRKLYDNFVSHKKYIENSLRAYNQTKNSKQQITILVPLWISVHVINARIPQFLEENEDLKLRVIYGDRNVDFIKENIDIAVVTGEQKQSFQIMRYLGCYKNLFYCRSDYTKIDDLPNNLTDLLQKHKMLAYSYDDVTHKIDATAKQNIFSEADNELVDSISIESDLTVSMYTGASQLMQYSNKYIALDYEFALKEKFATQKFIRVLPQYYAGVREYYITLPERKLEPQKQKVYDFLVDVVTQGMTFKKDRP